MFSIKNKLNFETIYWLGLFILLIYLFHGHTLCVDDIYFSFTNDKIKLLREYYYGSWVVPVNNLLFYYLPYKLSVNLQEWAQVMGLIVQTSVCMILFWYFSKFFEKFGQKKKLIMTTFVIMVFFFLMHLVKFVDFIIYSGFFRFILPSVLFVIWGYYFYKLLNGEKTKFLWLITLLTASSSEVVGTILVVTSFVLFVYFEEKKSKDLLFVFVFSLTGLVILLSSFGFHQHLDTKSGIHTLSEFSDNILPFLKVYLKKFILKQGLFWATIFALIYLNKKYSKNSGVEISFSLSLVFSVFLFVLSLVFLGKTHYSGGYWVTHRDLYTVFYTVFLFIFILLSQNLIQIFDETADFKKCLKSLALLCIPFFILSCVHLRSSISTIKSFYLLRDTMVLNYLSKDEDIILPRAVRPEFEYTVISHVIIDSKKFLRYYPLHRFFKDPPAEENIKSFNILLLNYYKQVYNYKSDKKDYYADFIDGDTAMKYYLDHGGKLPDKEKFSDLEIKP